MKYKLPELDLHGIYHIEVPAKVNKFLEDNQDNLPVLIITGNSNRMITIVKETVKSKGLEMNVKSHYNLGSFVIS
ncbi:MAG: hypothetical protein CBE33_03770 [Candidatus Pelagibacter sp. TMED273]|nr:MAG: hypothetical protein CBE33_03770 [Candidatus Pelagibacter sp. TMED273]|tara:strand:+ start:816 stop:1040 length:225 start_codon:yes stop_codon:yes gene_type:complete